MPTLYTYTQTHTHVRYYSILVLISASKRVLIYGASDFEHNLELMQKLNFNLYQQIFKIKLLVTSPICVCVCVILAIIYSIDDASMYTFAKIKG